jgi:hypothetical protein
MTVFKGYPQHQGMDLEVVQLPLALEVHQRC